MRPSGSALRPCWWPINVSRRHPTGRSRDSRDDDGEHRRRAMEGGNGRGPYPRWGGAGRVDGPAGHWGLQLSRARRRRRLAAAALSCRAALGLT